MIKVLAFNHFSATVADMDRALGFWRDSLGLELIGRGVVEYEHLDRIVGLPGTKIEWAELKIAGGGLVELFRYLNPPGIPMTGKVNDPGRTHLCLEVENLDGLIARIHEAGHRTVNPGPVTIPRGDWQGFRSVYAVAPDDVVVELVERPGR
jgi:catechol 2,3-dioxygenase-like lactoylglutathione lyase family enzyme